MPNIPILLTSIPLHQAPSLVAVDYYSQSQLGKEARLYHAQPRCSKLKGWCSKMKRKILSVLSVLMAVLVSTAALSACGKAPAGDNSSGGSGESVSTEQGGEPSVSESAAESSGESGAQSSTQGSFDPESAFTKPLETDFQRKIADNWDALYYVRELLALPDCFTVVNPKSSRFGISHGDYYITSHSETENGYVVAFSKELYMQAAGMPETSYSHIRQIEVSFSGEVLSDKLLPETKTLSRNEVDAIVAANLPPEKIDEKSANIASGAEAVDYMAEILGLSDYMNRYAADNYCDYRYEYYCFDSCYCYGDFSLYSEAGDYSDEGGAYYRVCFGWNESRVLQYVDVGNGGKKPLTETGGGHIAYAVYPNGKVAVLSVTR